MFLLLRVSMNCVELNKNVVFESIFIVNVDLSVDDDVKTLEGSLVE